MVDAFIIETASITAGIIAAQERGFRFYASHPAMVSLEGQTFGSVRAAQRAAELLAPVMDADRTPSNRGNHRRRP